MFNFLEVSKGAKKIKIYLAPELSHMNKACLKIHPVLGAKEREEHSPYCPSFLETPSVSQSTNFYWVLPCRRHWEQGTHRDKWENPSVPTFVITPKKKETKKCWAPKDTLCKNVGKEDKPFKRVTLGVPFPSELNVTALRTCTFWFPDFAKSKASIMN